ncbi:MAG: UvrD-helicase domain-containing protein [Erysipelotrichaceae bacterium]|nr:UvrD-helicase domain-containing protein [Erysipelotrichaceae bacterium]
MAEMIDLKPSYKGEEKVWESFKKNLPDDWIVYNNRTVQGKEFDFCILIPETGILIVEVKGWNKTVVTVNSDNTASIAGVYQPVNPYKQANGYRFALLNSIQKKYGDNPTVLSMVAFPNLSKADFSDLKMNGLGDENLSIFKEDLERSYILTGKIRELFKLLTPEYAKKLPNSLMQNIRFDWEAKSSKQNSQNSFPKYSRLSVEWNALSNELLSRLVSEYIGGVKQIIFVQEPESFLRLQKKLVFELDASGIQPIGLNLENAKNEVDLEVQEQKFQIFNFEAYLVSSLNSIAENSFSIEDGQIESDFVSVLNKLNNLTPFNYGQYCVEHAPLEDNILIMAGAGTGKSHTLITRLGYICHMDPEQPFELDQAYAMITFTNDAAASVKKRLRRLFENYFVLTRNIKYLRLIQQIEGTKICTIHKLITSLIRENSGSFGVGSDFLIADRQFLRNRIYLQKIGDFLVKKNKENPDNQLSNRLPAALYDIQSSLMNLASVLNNKSIDTSSFDLKNLGTVSYSNFQFYNEMINDVLFQAEKEYNQNLNKQNLVSLSSLMSFFSSRIKENSELQNALHSLKYLVIDEFQDTDSVQIQMFAKLLQANGHCALTIVGDLKQSIYRFRGATLSAFQEIQDLLGGNWDVFYLNKNYRTDHRLLDLLDPVFEKMGEKEWLPYRSNTDRLRSSLTINEPSPELVKKEFISKDVDDNDPESFENKLVETVKNELHLLEEANKNHPLSREANTVAILTRKNREAKKVRNILQKHGIAVQGEDEVNLFEHKAVRDLYSLINAMENSFDPVSLSLLINSNLMDKVFNYRKLKGMDENKKREAMLSFIEEEFLRKTGVTFTETVGQFKIDPALYVINKAFKSMTPWAHENGSTNQKAYLNVFDEIFSQLIKTFQNDEPTLAEIRNYLEINMTTGQEILSQFTTEKENKPTVLVTTVHKSKGLEYGIVILPFTDFGLAGSKHLHTEAYQTGENLAYHVSLKTMNGGADSFQNSYFDEDYYTAESKAEECRILYVALTRAISRIVYFADQNKRKVESWGSLMENDTDD